MLAIAVGIHARCECFRRDEHDEVSVCVCEGEAKILGTKKYAPTVCPIYMKGVLLIILHIFYCRSFTSEESFKRTYECSAILFVISLGVIAVVNFSFGFLLSACVVPSILMVGATRKSSNIT